MDATRRGVLRGLALLLAVVLCAGPWSASAQAGELGDFKQSGQVGEQIDGYVGLVEGAADPQAKAVVERVNAERRQAYGAIAAKQGLAPEQVAAVAGARLIAATPGGQFVKDSTGAWKRK